MDAISLEPRLIVPRLSTRCSGGALHNVALRHQAIHEVRARRPLKEKLSCSSAFWPGVPSAGRSHRALPGAIVRRGRARRSLGQPIRLAQMRAGRQTKANRRSAYLSERPVLPPRIRQEARARDSCWGKARELCDLNAVGPVGRSRNNFVQENDFPMPIRNPDG
jgi:hypothetical protein